MTYDAVIFDFHRTLVMGGPFEDWLTDAAALAGCEVEVARVLPVLRTVWSRAAVRHPDTAWDLDPAMHRRAFEEVLVEEGDCPAPVASALYDLMPGQWRAVPGAVELLVGLRAHGLRVGLLSNTALDLRPRLAELGILEHLDAVLLSVEEGLVKPDPRLFERAAGALGVHARRCVYVGDTPAADGGAVAAGMTCVLVPVVDDIPQLATTAALLGIGQP